MLEAWGLDDTWTCDVRGEAADRRMGYWFRQRHELTVGLYEGGARPPPLPSAQDRERIRDATERPQSDNLPSAGELRRPPVRRAECPF